ncbi:hypothetical protein A2Z22_04135 [Candidatus Woesebacteria bacterium RBG_16_34_12]|uniref:Uncharacterized protein n=1 Tax=Candidatus Woesebacteria bacterium RBG_16_34_12 TaxID=1802480 RepID=A0A1F7X7I7_9BACT|nr:MAG: hypothetical protein A2Z22_04135 [Candidatus Woesebacteria bacterium RBG_16_34_12]
MERIIRVQPEGSTRTFILIGDRQIDCSDHCSLKVGLAPSNGVTAYNRDYLITLPNVCGDPDAPLQFKSEPPYLPILAKAGTRRTCAYHNKIDRDVTAVLVEESPGSAQAS